MANAILDASQEGDPIVASRWSLGSSDGGRAKKRPDRGGEFRGSCEHLRGGTAQWRLARAAHGKATPDCGGGGRQVAEFRGDPNWRRKRWQDSRRVRAYFVCTNDASGDRRATCKACGPIEIEVSGARTRVDPHDLKVRLKVISSNASPTSQGGRRRSDTLFSRSAFETSIPPLVLAWGQNELQNFKLD